MTQEIKPELLDELLSGLSKPEDLLGDGGLFRQLKKALMERALGGELTHHLGYEKGDQAGRGSGNSRNGHSSKTVLTEDGELDLSIPRDRAGTFEPVLVPKGVTRLEGFDDKVISLYARGLTVREIQGHLREMYGTEVSPDLISRVTDAVLEEVKEWQARPLDACYPIVFFDALRVKIRDEGLVRNKAVYVALALDAEGHKHVLGLWIEQTEGAKFRLKVMNDLKTRGLGDILIAVVDGLKGFPEAIGAVFPETMVQTCIIHLIRNSLAFVSWKDRKQIMPDLKAIYRAEAALDRLAEFEGKWDARYPAIGQSWRRAWEHVIPLFAFPPDIRKMIYTTDEIDKTSRAKLCYGLRARATPWRRAGRRLQVPPDRLFTALPAWSVRAPLGVSPIGRRSARRIARLVGRLPSPARAST
jgi:putative transposase